MVRCQTCPDRLSLDSLQTVCEAERAILVVILGTAVDSAEAAYVSRPHRLRNYKSINKICLEAQLIPRPPQNEALGHSNWTKHPSNSRLTALGRKAGLAERRNGSTAALKVFAIFPPLASASSERAGGSSSG